MIMKMKMFTAILVMAFAMTSCGNKKSSTSEAESQTTEQASVKADAEGCCKKDSTACCAEKKDSCCTAKAECPEKAE